MSKFNVVDDRDKSRTNLYIGAVDFEYNGELYYAKLGTPLIIWKSGNSRLKIEVDLSQEVDQAVDMINEILGGGNE